MSKFFYIQLLAFMAVIGAGCRKEQPVVAVDPTEIRLTSGVWSVVPSKAVVVSGERFMASVCGWQLASTEVDWAIAPDWKSNADILAGSAAVSVDLLPTQIYNDKGLTTVVRAWYPSGKLEQGKVRFENPTAELDVLLAGAISGTKNYPITKPMLFIHLTTQFRFVLTGSWFSQEPILSIKVYGIRSPVGVDLKSGSLLGSVEVDLMVQGAPVGGVTPSAAGVEFGRSMMVLPIEGNRIKVDVTTPRKTYKNIEVTTTDTQFTAGRAYTVTLNFHGERNVVIGSSAIADWPQYGQGSADVT